MSILTDLLIDVRLRLAALTAQDVVDIVLVAITFYLIFSFMRRTQAAPLIRGVLILVLSLLLINLISPLPTFDRIVLVVIATLLIAIPITLQTELRRALEQIGRNPLRARLVRRSLGDVVSQPLRRAVRQLSAEKTGALIVLEGQHALDEIVTSGISIHAQLSDELLRTIFYDKNPLHDGAVIVRAADAHAVKVAAAGCVLPLTEQPLVQPNRRMGTRHRAAVGISEVSDALAIVVSEETGHVSAAQRGQLATGLDDSALQQVIVDFYLRSAEQMPAQRQRWHWLRGLGRGLVYAGSAVLFALLAWAVVVDQTNPTAEQTIEAVPLRVQGSLDNVTLLNSAPSLIEVQVKATEDVLQSLQSDSFQATLSLDGLAPGLHRLPIVLETSATQLQVLEIRPSEVDIELVSVVSKTLPVELIVEGAENLSVVFEPTGTNRVSPDMASIRGPEPRVAQVAALRTVASIDNATNSLRSELLVVPVDSAGQPIEGVSVEPSIVKVVVPIRRRLDVREVGVRAVTTGTPPDGFWLSELSVEPANITLQGDPALLTTHSNFINTLPIDINSAFGDVQIAIPLDVPSGMQAYDADGSLLNTVTVYAQLSTRQGDLLLERPIELFNNEGMTVTLASDTVELLLSGDLPTLREIEQSPELVRVLIDAGQFSEVRGSGQVISAEVIPTIILPDTIRYQLINSPILIQLR